jgi:hypothetical protein
VLKPKAFADEMREELCAACENYGGEPGGTCRT